MHPAIELHRRVWADILALEPGRALISSFYPETEQPAVVNYFIALHLRGLAEVQYAQSRRAPRVATLTSLTEAGRQLQARKPVRGTARPTKLQGK